MAQRLFLTAAVVFTLVSQPPSLRAQDDTSPISPETKKRGGLHDLLAPADREKKAPIPPLAEREKARELVREAFGRPNTPKQRAALVRTLIKTGLDDKNPANRYVAFRHAGELAVENADLAAASEAADSLREFFDVDVLAIKASVVERLFGKVTHQELLWAASSHFDEALASDRFEVAARFGRVGYKAAKALKDERQIASMRKSAEWLKQRKAAFDALKGAIATLKQKPDDAPANLQVGEYLCFLRGDWKWGLPLLVKGGHAITKQEAAATEDPAAQKKVGDAWWDLADMQTGRAQTHIKTRAATWYRRAAPRLTGLNKKTVEKRLATISASAQVDLSVSRIKEFRWRPGNDSARVIHKNGGLCFLSALGGGFAGRGEIVWVKIGDDGFWQLGGKANQKSVGVRAIGVTIPGFQGGSVLVKRFRWSAGAEPVKMIHQDQGLCFLSGIGGKFAGAGEYVRVKVGDDGFWLLGGRSTQSSVTAEAFSVTIPGFQAKSAVVTRFFWSAGKPAVKMIHKDQGFCFLSGIGGKLADGREQVRVKIRKDGFWYLHGKSNQSSFNAQAIAVQFGK